MFVYKWPADKENDTGIVGQHSSCDVRGEGPLSTPLTVCLRCPLQPPQPKQSDLST